MRLPVSCLDGIDLIIHCPECLESQIRLFSVDQMMIKVPICCHGRIEIRVYKYFNQLHVIMLIVGYVVNELDKLIPDPGVGKPKRF